MVCKLYLKKADSKIKKVRGFPGGPVVKNLPCNAGDTGSIPGWGTKIPHSEEATAHRLQLESLCAAMKDRA